MYCFSSVNCHGGWDRTMQSVFARSNGQEGQSVAKVAVKRTHTARNINLAYQCKCNHKLPLFDQCQQYFWFCTAHTFIFHLPASDTPTHTHTQYTVVS